MILCLKGSWGRPAQAAERRPAPASVPQPVPAAGQVTRSEYQTIIITIITTSTFRCEAVRALDLADCCLTSDTINILLQVPAVTSTNFKVVSRDTLSRRFIFKYLFIPREFSKGLNLFNILKVYSYY